MSLRLLLTSLVALVLATGCDAGEATEDSFGLEEHAPTDAADAEARTLDRGLVDALAHQPDLLVHQASFRTELQDGAPSVWIEAVRPQTLPQVLGLRAGDRLVSIDGLPLTSFAELVSRLDAHGHVELHYEREGESHTMLVTLG